MAVPTMRFNATQALARYGVLEREGTLAVRRALRRTATNVRTVMVREVRADIGLPASVVRDEIKLHVDHQALVASVSVSGRPIPLIAFGAKGPMPTRGRGRGVSYRIGRQGRKTIPKAFIARVRGPLPSGVVSPGHTGVFVRIPPSLRTSAGAWSKNLPIKQRYGPSLPKVFEKHIPAGLARAEEQFPKNLAHELRRFALAP